MSIFGRLFGGARSFISNIFGRSAPEPLPEAQDLMDEEDIPEPQEVDQLDIEEIPEEPEPADYFEDVYENQTQEPDYYQDELEGFTDEFGQIKSEYADMLDTMVEHGYISSFQSDDERREFLRFLQSDFWESKKQYIYTPGTMQAVQTAIRRGAKVSDLEQAYNDWMLFGGEEDIEEIWEGWQQF